MITSNDAHEYHCHDCGSKWKARDRYVWWPIRLGWTPRGAWEFKLTGIGAFFRSWGWQIGWDGIEQRVFGRTVRIGPVLVKFGACAR